MILLEWIGGNGSAVSDFQLLVSKSHGPTRVGKRGAAGTTGIPGASNKTLLGGKL
jgi:hypothetical protein